VLWRFSPGWRTFKAFRLKALPATGTHDVGLSSCTYVFCTVVIWGLRIIINLSINSDTTANSHTVCKYKKLYAIKLCNQWLGVIRTVPRVSLAGGPDQKLTQSQTVCSGTWRPRNSARADFSPSPQLVGPNMEPKKSIWVYLIVEVLDYSVLPCFFIICYRF